MSIATELTRIQQAKADIKTAIEAKGVTVPSSATIDTYDDYVSQISGGGGESWITPIPQSSYTATTFYPRAAIMSVDIPSGVTSIGESAFLNYENLTSVIIPDSVTTIGNSAFHQCSGLTSVTIPNSVTSIGQYAFDSCSSFTSITIGSGVTNISIAAFEYCANLTSINIPNSVTTLGAGVFYRCSGLTNCTIGTGITNIGSSAFLHCSGLTGVTIEAVTPPTLGNNAFNNTNDCPIYVPSGSVETYKSASNWSNYASRIQAIPSLEYIPFDTRMEQYQDKYIKRIVIGDSSTYSGATFDMGESGGSRLHFGSDGSTVTAYGDFVVDGVTNLTLPIDITPVNPVQLTNNNWGKTTVISWWPYEAEIYNGFSDLHIEWQN